MDQDQFNYRAKINPDFNKKNKTHRPTPKDYTLKTLYLYDRFVYKSLKSATKKLNKQFTSRQIPADKVVEKFIHNALILNDLSKRKGWRNILAMPAVFILLGIGMAVFKRIRTSAR